MRAVSCSSPQSHGWGASWLWLLRMSRSRPCTGDGLAGRRRASLRRTGVAAPVTPPRLLLIGVVRWRVSVPA